VPVNTEIRSTHKLQVGLGRKGLGAHPLNAKLLLDGQRLHLPIQFLFGGTFSVAKDSAVHSKSATGHWFTQCLDIGSRCFSVTFS
jgi:hypothetical protein